MNPLKNRVVSGTACELSIAEALGSIPSTKNQSFVTSRSYENFSDYPAPTYLFLDKETEAQVHTTGK